MACSLLDIMLLPKHQLIQALVQIAAWSRIEYEVITDGYHEDDDGNIRVHMEGLIPYDTKQCQHYGGCAKQLVYHGTKDLQGILESGEVRPGPEQKNCANGVHYDIPLTWRPWSYCRPIQVGFRKFLVVVCMRAHCGKRVPGTEWFYTRAECFKRLEIVELILKPIPELEVIAPVACVSDAMVTISDEDEECRDGDADDSSYTSEDSSYTSDASMFQ